MRFDVVRFTCGMKSIMIAAMFNVGTSSAIPPCNLQPSLLLLCMDIRPNPGPTTYEPTQDEDPQPPKLTKLFNVTKTIQLKLVRHQHHLQNYIYYRKNNIIPKGLNSKCRPTISTNNPCFYEQWQKNRLINGRINLKLLTQECRRIIKTLEEQLAIKKELLRKNSSIECFNYYNEKLSSMARSLEILLFNRRLRKNISTRPNQTNQIVHSTSSTPHHITSRLLIHPVVKGHVAKTLKKPPTLYNDKPNVPLDTSSVINLSNVTLTNDETQLLAKGLTFCPKPRLINWTEVNADFNEFARRMRITEFFHDHSTGNESNPFYPKSLWTPPTDRDDALNAIML